MSGLLAKSKFMTFEDFLFEEGEKLGIKQIPYAVPVDKKIISTIDNPVTTEFIKSYVNASTDITYGQIIAESILSSPSCYPEVYNVAKKCAEKLCMPMVDVYISPLVSGMNAITIGTDDETCIILGSLLTAILNEEQLAFVIGHEMGHIASGHILYHTALQNLRNSITLIPIVGDLIYKATVLPLFSWYRRSELTADRAGLLCCGNVETALDTMLQLMAGFMDTSKVDVNEYIEKSSGALDKNFFRKIGELTQSHPLTVKRLKALQLFSESKKYERCNGVRIQDKELLSDAELEAQTEAIVKIM